MKIPPNLYHLIETIGHRLREIGTAFASDLGEIEHYQPKRYRDDRAATDPTLPQSRRVAEELTGSVLELRSAIHLRALNQSENPKDRNRIAPLPLLARLADFFPARRVPEFDHGLGLLLEFMELVQAEPGETFKRKFDVLTQPWIADHFGGSWSPRSPDPDIQTVGLVVCGSELFLVVVDWDGKTHEIEIPPIIEDSEGVKRAVPGPIQIRARRD